MANKSNINISGLIKYAEMKKEKTIERVDIAIKKIILDKHKVNFNSVAQVSGVSKAYLYKNMQIRERIEALRQQTSTSFKSSKGAMTESSKDIVIISKDKKIRDLKEENKNLKKQLMDLRGKIYDNL